MHAGRALADEQRFGDAAVRVSLDEKARTSRSRRSAKSVVVGRWLREGALVALGGTVRGRDLDPGPSCHSLDPVDQRLGADNRRTGRGIASQRGHRLGSRRPNAEQGLRGANIDIRRRHPDTSLGRLDCGPPRIRIRRRRLPYGPPRRPPPHPPQPPAIGVGAACRPSAAQFVPYTRPRPRQPRPRSPHLASPVTSRRDRPLPSLRSPAGRRGSSGPCAVQPREPSAAAATAPPMVLAASASSTRPTWTGPVNCAS